MDYEDGEVRQDPRLTPREGETRLRLWYFAPIGISIEWHVVAADDRYFVRRFIERREEDGEPEELAAESELSDEKYWFLVHGLRAVRLTPFEPSELVFDDETFGVWAHSYPHSVKLSWTGTPPRNWSSLRAWYKGAVKALDAQLPARQG